MKCIWYGCVKEIMLNDEGKVISVELTWKEGEGCKPKGVSKKFEDEELTKSLLKAAEMAVGRCVAIGVRVEVNGEKVTYKYAAIVKPNKKCCPEEKEKKEEKEEK